MPTTSASRRPATITPRADRRGAAARDQHDAGRQAL
jgi:hypothetical protein